MPSGDSGDGSGDARRKGSAGKNGAKSQQSASAPKRRAGTKGKPGKALTLENLQAVFGLSLQVRFETVITTLTFAVQLRPEGWQGPLACAPLT